MFLGDGLERFPARIGFLVRIVREGSYLSLCLVLETTIPPFTLMAANVVLSDFIDDSDG
jgi:hypothetical protein